MPHRTRSWRQTRNGWKARSQGNLYRPATLSRLSLIHIFNTLNPTGTEEAKLKAYQADKAKFEANAENQLYKGDAESKDDANRCLLYTSVPTVYARFNSLQT